MWAGVCVLLFPVGVPLAYLLLLVKMRPKIAPLIDDPEALLGSLAAAPDAMMANPLHLAITVRGASKRSAASRSSMFGSSNRQLDDEIAVIRSKEFELVPLLASLVVMRYLSIPKSYSLSLIKLYATRGRI